MDLIRAELSGVAPDLRKVQAALDSLLTASKQCADLEAFAESLSKDGGFAVLCQVLATAALPGGGTGDPGGDRVRSCTAVAMLIAEAAKAENCRPMCLECGLIDRLLDLLDRHDCEPLCVQALRALANLCFDQDDCRARINTCDGVRRIVGVLRCQLSSRRSSAETSGISERSAGDASSAVSKEAATCSSHARSEPCALGGEQLLIVTCGCLHNLTNNNEILQNAVLDAGTLPLLLQLVSADGSNSTPDAACRFTLGILASLATADRGREALSSPESITALSELYLRTSSTLDIEVLPLLSDLAKESDAVKSVVARTGAIAKLMSTVTEALTGRHLAAVTATVDGFSGQPSSERDADEDDDSDSKSSAASAAADLLVLTLSGDEALAILLESCGRNLIRTIMNWLTADYGDNELRTSAALALGNVARGDANVKLLVSQGVGPALVNLLRELSSASSATAGSGDAAAAAGSGDRLSYAVLNTIRNISVPALGKEHLVECGALPVVMSYVKSPTSAGPVKSRALAALRLLVDKRVAVAEVLCSDVDFLRQVASLAVDNDSHSICKAEAMRLVAWTVKAASDKRELLGRLVADAGAVPALLTLLDSEHTLMQGEAIIALLLALRSQPDACREPLAAGDLGSGIAKVLESCMAMAGDFWPAAHAVEGTRDVATELANGTPDAPNEQDAAASNPCTAAAAVTTAAAEPGTTAAATDLGVKTLHNCLLLINQIIITDRLLPAVLLAASTTQIVALLRRMVAAAALRQQQPPEAREPTILAEAVLQALERSQP